MKINYMLEKTLKIRNYLHFLPPTIKSYFHKATYIAHRKF